MEIEPQDTPVSRTEFKDLTNQKAFLEALRHRRTQVVIRLDRVRDQTKTKLGIISKRIARIDKEIAKLDAHMTKVECLMDGVYE